MTNWEHHQSWSSYNYIKSCRGTQTSIILWPFGIWSKLEREKSSRSECLMSWQKILKKNVFWNVIFYFVQQQTISQSDCDVQWKVHFTCQPVATNSVVWPRRSSKAFPKAKLAPKKGLWSLFGGLLLVWSTTAFWIPVKPLQLRSRLSKLMRCIENCNACNYHCSTEKAQFFSITMPDCTLHNQCFKNWTNWVTKFCLICHIHQPPSPDNFLQGKCFHNQQNAENAFWGLAKSWSMDFYAVGINKFINKNVLIVMVPILINKDVFESSYNDLKSSLKP